MVNTGRPSKGCLTCRKRRVKCDEAKPSCRRCIKLKSECKWQDEWTSLIRRQETWAEKKVVQRVERVQYLRDALDARQGVGLCSQAKLPYGVAFARQPQLRPELYATDRFYLEYAFAVNTCPFLYPVQPLYDSSSTPNCLHSVIPAVSLASAAKCLNRHDLMRQAEKHYGDTLRKLAQNIADPTAAKADATLLTVYLLGLFELISLDRHPGRKPPWEIHGTGRLAILRLRGFEQLATQSGRNLFVILYQEHLISCFLGKSDLLDECSTWMRASFPPSPIVAMMLLMHDLCTYLKSLKKSIDQNDRSLKDISNLVKEGRTWYELAADLLHVFQSGEATDSITMRHYAGHIPDHNTSQRQDRDSEASQRPGLNTTNRVDGHGKSDANPPKPDGMESIPEDEIKKYLSVTRAVGTNFLRAAFMFLLDGILAAMAFLDKHDPLVISDHEELEAHREEYNTVMEQLAVQICQDIPFSLGYLDHEARPVDPPVGGLAFRAYLSLWPMQTALRASQTPPLYKNKLLRRLKHIGEKVGIGMAFHVLSEEKIDVHDILNEEDDFGRDIAFRPVLKADDAVNDHVSWAISQNR